MVIFVPGAPSVLGCGYIGFLFPNQCAVPGVPGVPGRCGRASACACAHVRAYTRVRAATRRTLHTLSYLLEKKGKILCRVRRVCRAVDKQESR